MIFGFMLESKLRSWYDGLRPTISNVVDCEEEFIYAGKYMNKNMNLSTYPMLLKNLEYYMLVKTRLALGENIYNAIEKTKKEYADVTEMGIILISIYHEGKLCGFRFDKTAIPNAQIKNSVVTAYNTTKKIVENSEMFYTRPELVGDVDNPILVDGIVGLRGYIENLKYSNGIRYERSDVKYVNNNLINLKYAIDEYRLIDKVTGETITKLYFNIYGTANLRTKYVPQIFEN